MTFVRAIALFSAIGLLSLAGAFLCLTSASVQLELKYVGVTTGFFLALLSAAKVQELRRAMRQAPLVPPGTEAPKVAKPEPPRPLPALVDEDADLAAKLEALRARARSVPAAHPEAAPQITAAAAGHEASHPTSHLPALHQRRDELRADIERAREDGRARHRQHAAAGPAVSVAPPGFLDELSRPQALEAVTAPTPLAPPSMPAPPRPAAVKVDPFARTQLSGLEVTHLAGTPQEEEGDEEEAGPFAKTQFTDFGHADHGQFASTEYLVPPRLRK